MVVLPPMMIVYAVSIVVVGFLRVHDCDRVIDGLGNLSDLSMHYPDSDYLFELVALPHLHRD